jgi:hypothetical protein
VLCNTVNVAAGNQRPGIDQSLDITDTEPVIEGSLDEQQSVNRIPVSLVSALLIVTNPSTPRLELAKHPL